MAEIMEPEPVVRLRAGLPILHDLAEAGANRGGSEVAAHEVAVPDR